ncbi:cell division protein FtsK [Flavipsychrobacter stenotrophus]|uniref:Cell division protein FtsK n=1 Tax=Flavipsychrobacter stenotrophus TaxID=2077091 RepID=A0A2S7SX76_9BACT|nr:DNA translocase FtsK [Flavipsychrobacter stenotrophus]PQJ11221.1 cell division protein FtsK [Flavipsychrobacter stenotrophus]
MATTKTKKAIPTVPEPPLPAGELPLHIDRKRQIRLGFGIFFLLTGVFTTVSIISYYYSWNADQDKFFSSNSLSQFLFKDHTPVANWGGRMGAAIAHLLVYSGAGIASMAIGIGIAAIGTNLIYGKKAAVYMRYARWVSIVLLLLAPVLTYLFPDSPFPLGGALGNATISYFNGLLGVAGTGMALLSIVLFFVFVIFALDISPFIKKMKERAAIMAASLKPVQEFNKPEDPAAIDEEEEEEEKAAVAPFAITNTDEIQAMPATGNKLKANTGHVPLIIAGEPANKEWEMDMVEKKLDHIDNHMGLVDANIEEEAEMSEEERLFNEWKTDAGVAEPHQPVEEDEYPEVEAYEEEDYIEEEEEDEEAPQPEFTFEVKQQENERPTIKHGAHISIASNEPYAPELDLPDYRFPTLDLMETRVEEEISLNKGELERNKDQIVQTLNSFGIEIQQISATVGPTVTLYEVVPGKGVRISKIKNLEDDIALSLAALGIRIIAPIPGKGTIGIEVPNANKQIVSMQALLSSPKFVDNKMSLPIALGKKIDNENYIVDLATMPHLLMAGATGQGKSVGINAILVSLLYKKHPSQLKFVMVDPKKVELSIYRTIEKHFLAKLPNEEEPIITDIKKVIYTLKALCDEMDDRYGLLKDAGARNIKEYNEKFIARRLNPENGHKYLPFIVLVIDEFADLIMTAGKEVEMPIARLAQLARAVGIHIIIATQRPSVNVITGTIKANFPARIAFKVSAKVDSRTILDTGGAEQLVGRGDMLISHGSELLRLQCAFVDTPEVENVVNFIGGQRGYLKAHPLPEPEMDDEDGGAKTFDPKNRDKLFEECARTVVQMQSGSTSNLQRRFNLGYNRAGRIMDQLEAAGIVGPAVGSKPRDVYFTSENELEEFFGTLK